MKKRYKIYLALILPLLSLVSYFIFCSSGYDSYLIYFDLAFPDESEFIGKPCDFSIESFHYEVFVFDVSRDRFLLFKDILLLESGWNEWKKAEGVYFIDELSKAAYGDVVCSYNLNPPHVHKSLYLYYHLSAERLYAVAWQK